MINLLPATNLKFSMTTEVATPLYTWIDAIVVGIFKKKGPSGYYWEFTCYHFVWTSIDAVGHLIFKDLLLVPRRRSTEQATLGVRTIYQKT